jgi:hypothetical protein
MSIRYIDKYLSELVTPDAAEIIFGKAFATVGSAHDKNTEVTVVVSTYGAESGLTRLTQALEHPDKGYTLSDLALISYPEFIKEVRRKTDDTFPFLVPTLPRSTLVNLLGENNLPQFLLFRYKLGLDSETGCRWGDRIDKSGGCLISPYEDGLVEASVLTLLLPHVQKFLAFREEVGGVQGKRWGDRTEGERNFVAPFGDGPINVSAISLLLPHMEDFLAFRREVGGVEGNRWGDRAGGERNFVAPFGGGPINVSAIALLLPHMDNFLAFRKEVDGDEGKRWGDRAEGERNFVAPFGDGTLSVRSLAELVSNFNSERNHKKGKSDKEKTDPRNVKRTGGNDKEYKETHNLGAKLFSLFA